MGLIRYITYEVEVDNEYDEPDYAYGEEAHYNDESIETVIETERENGSYDESTEIHIFKLVKIIRQKKIIIQEEIDLESYPDSKVDKKEVPEERI